MEIKQFNIGEVRLSWGEVKSILVNSLQEDNRIKFPPFEKIEIERDGDEIVLRWKNGLEGELKQAKSKPEYHDRIANSLT